MKKNYLIIILAFIMVGLIGFITYDSFFRLDAKCNVNETTTTATDSTKTDSKTEKTSDERYKEYLSNLSKSIETKYEDFVDMDKKALRQTIRGTIINGGGYYLEINKNKELKLIDYDNGDKYKDYKIADNVVSMYRIHIGNGGYSSIYYITTEGKVYYASLELNIERNEDIISKEVENVKNIIEVREGAGTNASVTMFIDIDGNIYTPGVAE